MTPEQLDLDQEVCEEEDVYPITLTLSHARNEEGAIMNGSHRPSCNTGNNSSKRTADPRNGQSFECDGKEVVKAKYLIGCDGAHSWVRTQLGIPMEGKQSDSVWGVMDIIPLTNFRKEPFSTM